MVGLFVGFGFGFGFGFDRLCLGIDVVGGIVIDRLCTVIDIDRLNVVDVGHVSTEVDGIDAVVIVDLDDPQPCGGIDGRLVRRVDRFLRRSLDGAGAGTGRLGAIGARRVGDHHRERARGRCEIDVLVRLAQRLHLGDDVNSNETSALERLRQTIAPVDELLDLLACKFTPASELAEHPLTIRTRLVDHFATLLLGHRQL